MWSRWPPSRCGFIGSTGETGRAVRHAPDFFARRADGTGMVIDVRPDDRIKDRDAAVFTATARICGEVGWDYQRVGELAPVAAANLRWLAGYRHPRSGQGWNLRSVAVPEPSPCGGDSGMS